MSVYQVHRLKINTRNPTVFQYANNEHAEIELKNIIPFKICRKENDILRYKSNKTCIIRSYVEKSQNSD